METPDQLGETLLNVAEHFYSIQGEGRTVGAPSVFLRMAMCNFNCVWCDTVSVWKRGVMLSADQLNAVFIEKGYHNRIKKGAHLILTGGDPMIQQEEIAKWFRHIGNLGHRPERMYVEVETQGYIMPRPEFALYVKQWNVSPKLANSGVQESKRVNVPVLQWHAQQNSFFKFPVASEEDLLEVDAIVRIVGIKRTRVYLMPVCSTREDHARLSEMVVDQARMSGYYYSPRMQVALWDKTTGV